MAAIPDAADTSERLCKDVLATSREVYATNRGTVVKVPSYEGGKANQYEVENWEEFGDPRLMAPIVDYADDYSWVEMVRCIRLTDRDDHLVDAFIEKIRQFDITIGDLHIDNIGIHPQTYQLVSIDYADADRKW